MRAFRRRTTVIARGKSNTRAAEQHESDRIFIDGYSFGWVDYRHPRTIGPIADGLIADRLGSDLSFHGTFGAAAHYRS